MFAVIEHRIPSQMALENSYLIQDAATKIVVGT